MKTKFTIFTILFSLSSWAIKDINVSDFKHLNHGCPENSICSKETGKTADFFDKSLIAGNGKLRKFFKKYGLPINAYNGIDPSKKESFGVSYNSACQSHRKQGLFYTANFIKATTENKNRVYVYSKKEITLDHTLHYRPIYIIRKAKPAKINVGVLDYPSFIDGNKLGLIGEFNDHLFQYSVDTKQRVRLLNTKMFTNDKVILSKEVVECPEVFKKIEIPKYFSVRFCKQLLNIKTNKIETILDFKACN